MIDARDIAPDRIRPLARAEYDRLVDLGVFEGERVELLRGALVEMSPQGPIHMAVISRLTRLLVAAIGDRGSIRVQGPLAVSADSEPEPDVAVAPPSPDDYATAHPTTALLVIEVAVTSQRKDAWKAALYAGCGVAEYWLVDAEAGTILVHRDPIDGGYRDAATRRAGETIELAAFPDVRIAVDDVLLRA